MTIPNIATFDHGTYADCQLCSFGNTTHSRLDVGHFGMDCSLAKLSHYFIFFLSVFASPKQFIYIFPFQSQVVFVFFNSNFEFVLCLCCLGYVCVKMSHPLSLTFNTCLNSMRFSMVRAAKLAVLRPFFRVHPWRPDVPTPTRIRSKNWSSGREGFV